LIKTLLVDDHPSFRDPLAFMFEREPDLKVLAQAGSLSEARTALQNVGPSVDLVLIDLDLPDGSGTQLIGEIQKMNPDALVLVLTAFKDEKWLARAIDAGASGVLHKSARVGEVISAVRRLFAGEQLVSPNEVAEAVRFMDVQRREKEEASRLLEKLTPREKEVLRALAEGLSDKELARSLHVNIDTVQTHMGNIRQKLEVVSRLQALVFAVRHGVVKIE
jgi:DNA-binding NarL/FixJ family response regulator